MKSTRFLQSFVPWWPVVIVLGVAFYTRLQFPPQYDETAHLHFSQYIAEHPTWHTLVTYEGSEGNEAKAPFVFIVGAAAGAVAGFTLPVMRLLVLLSAVAGLWYFGKLARLLPSNIPRWRLYSVVGVPFFIMLSLTYMTDMPTLALMYVSAYGLLQNQERCSVGPLICSILASTAMLYTRIDSVFLLAGIGLGFVVRRSIPLRVLLGLLLPVLLRVPLVILWGGLAAPPARLRSVPVEAGFLPVNVVFALCVVGLYFFPFSLQRLTDRFRLRAAVTALAGLLFVAFMPSFNDPSPDAFGGVLRSLLVAVTPATGYLRNTVLAVLLLAGCQVLNNSSSLQPRQSQPVVSLQLSILWGSGMQALRGVVMYERYLILPFGFLLLLILNRGAVNLVWSLWFVGVFVIQFCHLHQHHMI